VAESALGPRLPRFTVALAALCILALGSRWVIGWFSSSELDAHTTAVLQHSSDDIMHRCRSGMISGSRLGPVDQAAIAADVGNLRRIAGTDPDGWWPGDDNDHVPVANALLDATANDCGFARLTGEIVSIGSRLPHWLPGDDRFLFQDVSAEDDAVAQRASDQLAYWCQRRGSSHSAPRHERLLRRDIATLLRIGRSHPRIWGDLDYTTPAGSAPESMNILNGCGLPGHLTRPLATAVGRQARGAASA
jgi:hypothetical protein